MTCPSLPVQDGQKIELLVTLAPQLVSLGHPIRRGLGCDAVDKVCTVLMDRDRSVTIEVGWSVSPISAMRTPRLSASALEWCPDGE